MVISVNLCQRITILRKIICYPICPICCHSVIILIQIHKKVKEYRGLDPADNYDSPRKRLS